MRTNFRTVHALVTAGALAAASVAVAGCAHTTPPELADARKAYQSATQSAGAPLVPGDIADAKHSLAVAEQAYSMKGDSPASRDYAYIALRRSMSARSKAETAAALQQRQVALDDLERARRARAMAEATELQRQRSMLASEQRRLESERQARIAADAALKNFTISGSVVFASNKSDLLPPSQARLKDVAGALKNDTRPITVVGHADSTGNKQHNEKLSQDRADSVKKFLVDQGIPADRITTNGKGEEDPVATNKTAEGRANNRRAEIVLPQAPPDRGMSPDNRGR